MKITISQSLIDAVSLAEIKRRFPYEDTYHPNNPIGQPYHNLYAYISTLFNGIKIADLGTCTGNSALSLSYNDANHVDSYEVEQKYYDIVCEHIHKENISFHFKSVLDDPELLKFDLICIDVDPHDGLKEQICFNFLQQNNWKGIVLLDDIGPSWIQLHSWWNGISLPKWDLTPYGHFSGTGLVDFTGDLEVELL